MVLRCGRRSGSPLISSDLPESLTVAVAEPGVRVIQLTTAGATHFSGKRPAAAVAEQGFGIVHLAAAEATQVVSPVRTVTCLFWNDL